MSVFTLLFIYIIDRGPPNPTSWWFYLKKKNQTITLMGQQNHKSQG